MSKDIDLQEENRIANIDLNGDFDALQLYIDYLVYNHIDGERVYEITDWEVTDIDGIEDSKYVDTVMIGWVEDQLNGAGDYILITASSKSTIHIEDS